MSWHYLLLTLRTLKKSLIFTFINLGGLVIAMTCAFLIFLYVVSELGTDRFHQKKDDIYRVYTTYVRDNGEIWNFNSTPNILAQTLLETYPFIKEATRIADYNYFYGGQYILHDGNYIRESSFIAVDPGFFKTFSIRLLLGNNDNLINDMHSIVISKRLAGKYFPGENPVGQMLTIKNYNTEEDFQVTGVFDDLPANSTIKADVIGNINLVYDMYKDRGWSISGITTFVLLDHARDTDGFEEMLLDFAKTQHPDRTSTYHLQNLKDIYFHSDFFRWGDEDTGDYSNMLLFSLIGFIILIIASINYMIISTARSAERRVEFAIRKVFGADRRTIFKQIFIESLVVAVIALPIAMILSELLLPVLINLTGKEISIHYLSNLPYLIGLFAIALFVSFLSAGYIGFYVSRYNPEEIFKKRISGQSQRFNFRKVLITLQIVVFLVLLIFASVIMLQMDFAGKKSTGIQPENLVLINPPHDHNLFTCKTFTDEILKNPKIINVSEVNAGIFTPVQTISTASLPENPDRNVDLQILRGDCNFFDTYGFQLTDGRNFDCHSSTDSSKVIVNQTLVNELNITDPVGKEILSGGEDKMIIIGVVQDFHFTSIHTEILPTAITLGAKNEFMCQIAVKFHGQDVRQVMSFLEEKWDQFGPNGRFEYEFFNDHMQGLYEKDRKLADIIIIFTLAAIFISSMGLFGFSLYSTRQRIKEIGIRKVFGAGTETIVRMILKELVILVIIANLITWPVAYFISEGWLANFAYRIHVPIWLTLVSLAISLIIVVATSGITAVNAANKNPSDSLRYE
nr:ABC transporter permease [Bacteroidota bacterium]